MKKATMPVKKGTKKAEMPVMKKAGKKMSTYKKGGKKC